MDINSYFLCVTIPKYYLPVAVEKWKFQFTVNNFHESDYLSSFIIDNLCNKECVDHCQLELLTSVIIKVPTLRINILSEYSNKRLVSRIFSSTRFSIFEAN